MVGTHFGISQDGSTIGNGVFQNDQSMDIGLILTLSMDIMQLNLIIFLKESCNSLIIEGCTDSSAVNYDPNADTDDGNVCIVISTQLLGITLT